MYCSVLHGTITAPRKHLRGSTIPGECRQENSGTSVNAVICGAHGDLDQSFIANVYILMETP